MKKTTIRLDDDLHKEIMKSLIDRDMSFQEYVVSLIEKDMSERSGDVDKGGSENGVKF